MVTQGVEQTYKKGGEVNGTGQASNRRAGACSQGPNPQCGMGGKLHTKQKTETLKPRNEQHTFLSDCGGERESNSTDGRWGGGNAP
jgi:hypothetical protein